MVTAYDTLGWCAFAPDPATRAWAAAAGDAARAALEDPALAHWHQCEGTWFVGVDALANDASGAVSGVPLAGPAVEAVIARHGPLPALHRAQVSAVWPGYPRPRAGETEAAFGYRLRRDAAHVDGITAEGPARRRHLTEPHAWILGLPLTDSHPDAAPMVVWEGSHLIIAAALDGVLADHHPDDWPGIDLTDVYVAARADVFRRCRRVPVHMPPGGAYLVHRLAVHGVAPWTAPDAPPRIVAYFRPELEDPAGWIRP